MSLLRANTIFFNLSFENSGNLMIRFFRQIRRGLLSENKFSKYLLYALGEIVLVVLGILIALQINNWNVTKENERAVEEVLTNMLTDLDADIKDFNDLLLGYYHRKDSLIYLILNNKVSKEDYWNNAIPFIENVEQHYNKVTVRQESFKLFETYLDNIPEKFKSLVPDINQLYIKTYPNLNLWNNKMVDIHFKSIEDQEKYSWYTQPFPNAERIEYLVNDFNRKNRVKTYWGYAKNHIRILRISLDQAIILYTQIASKLDRPLIGSSFKVYNDIMDLWIGYYEEENVPHNFIRIMQDEEGLYFVSNGNKDGVGIFPLNKERAMTNNLGFLTLAVDKGNTFLRGNDFEFKKVKQN